MFDVAEQHHPLSHTHTSGVLASSPLARARIQCIIIIMPRLAHFATLCRCALRHMQCICAMRVCTSVLSVCNRRLLAMCARIIIRATLVQRTRSCLSSVPRCCSSCHLKRVHESMMMSRAHWLAMSAKDYNVFVAAATCYACIPRICVLWECKENNCENILTRANERVRARVRPVCALRH